jgi:hypothetical protein
MLRSMGLYSPSWLCFRCVFYAYRDFEKKRLRTNICRRDMGLLTLYIILRTCNSFSISVCSICIIRIFIKSESRRKMDGIISTKYCKKRTNLTWLMLNSSRFSLRFPTGNAGNDNMIKMRKECQFTMSKRWI